MWVAIIIAVGIISVQVRKRKGFVLAVVNAMASCLHGIDKAERDLGTGKLARDHPDSGFALPLQPHLNI